VTTETFAVPSGTFPYLVLGPAHYRASPPTGTLVVAHANVTTYVTFVPGATYTLSFRESGLARGSSWCVSLIGGTWQVCSTTATVAFANLAPATYTFSLGQIGLLTTLVKVGKSWVVESTGSIALTRTSAISVRFAVDVTFFEFTLPYGTAWSVTVGGETGSTSTSELSFYLINGTYTYRVHPVRGYLETIEVGQFQVAGIDELIQLGFEPD
jgi:hypothetical protein